MANGTIRLRSGEWAWHTMELRDGETQEIERIYVWFRLKGAEGSRMKVRLGPTEKTLGEKFLDPWARHPRERQILDESGTRWAFVELGLPLVTMGVSKDYRGEPYCVIFYSKDGRHGTGELPKDCGLGEATDEELLSLIRGAG